MVFEGRLQGSKWERGGGKAPEGLHGGGMFKLGHAGEPGFLQEELGNV